MLWSQDSMKINHHVFALPPFIFKQNDFYTNVYKMIKKVHWDVVAGVS
jgi:hypothetical protein